MRRSERPENPKLDPAAGSRPDLDRRAFLGAAAGLGVAALAPGARAAEPSAAEAPKAPRVERYGTLGRTGLRMPDISMGSGGTASESLVRYTFDRGVTYFDTAESYPMQRPGLAEVAIGKALVGRRDQVVIATKTVAQVDDSQTTLMKRLERSLRRLRTDYVDVFFNHAVNDVARLKSDAWAAFVEAAKQQGKIRFTGMSGHGGHLIECLEYALEHDSVDVILAAYNFGQDPAFYERFTKSFDLVANQAGLAPVLEKAHAKGVGVIAMKTLMGARLNDMRTYEKGGATFAQAAFRWVLGNPNVDGLIVSMKSREQIDEYLAASGRKGPQQAELDLLRRYAAANGKAYCRPGCGACEESCPHGVVVSEVLRTRMYAVDYGDAEAARSEYARLGGGATACAGCVTQACTGACPHDLEVGALTQGAHRMLGIA